MKWNLDKASRRRRVFFTISAIAAVGYLMLPTYFGLTERQTDIVFSFLLALFLSAYIFEDHQGLVDTAALKIVAVVVFLVLTGSALLVLLNGVQFHALIVVGGIVGGLAYWYLGKHQQ